MPRYYFHTLDGRDIEDNIGTELAGLVEARLEAVRTAGAILADDARAFWRDGTPWRMRVADESGAPVFTLVFTSEESTQPVAPGGDE